MMDEVPVTIELDASKGMMIRVDGDVAYRRPESEFIGHGHMPGFVIGDAL
jgi:hypothetical protein